MIGSDIINKIGGGSGINTGSLVGDLVDLNRAPEQQRLDRREELLKAQISDFGLLRSAMGELESAASAVSSRDTFDAKAVSVPDTSLLAFTKLEAKADAGNYQLQIEQTAQAHSLSTAMVSDLHTPLGQGEITLRFGDWSSALDSFAVNSERTGTTIVIDETNNTLSGLRDAINNADIGVQARIINDGSGYRLMLNGPSGASNELSLTVEEDPSAPGLGMFSFDENSQALTQQQEGRNAHIRLNGLLVTRESNQVTDVIEGLEFDIFNSDPAELINVNITADRNTAETAIRDFVAAYNTFVAEVKQLTGFNEENEEFGSLQNDSLAKSLMRNIRGFLGSAMPGIEGGFSTLGSLGIYTRQDGTLEINEDPDRPNTNFRAAFDNHYEKLRDFFVPVTQSSDSRVTVNGYGNRTQSGSYDVVITQEARKGYFHADPMNLSFPLETNGKDYSFALRVDGQLTDSLSLPENKVYASGAELAADLQSLINMDESLQARQVRLSVSFNSDTQALEFTSNAYGESSVVSFDAATADMADLGIAAGAGVAGQNVAGTINGENAFGHGNVLLPALRAPAEGLGLTIAPGVTEATVSFSRGMAGELNSLLNTFLASNGLIKMREDNIKDDLSSVSEDRTALERRSEAYRLRLQNQFVAMESIINSLNSTGNFLDGILDRLPFTAKKS